MTDKVEFEKERIVEVLRYIEELVVSLDRITSAYHDLPRELWREAVVEYFLESKGLMALSKCRTILSEPFSTELGEDDMDELERAMEVVKYWSYREFCIRHNVESILNVKPEN
jgi:hypothetical protein